LVTHGFFGERGVLTDLSSLFGGDVEVWWLNDVGEIVGSSKYPDGITRHAFLWKNGVMTDLGTLYPRCNSMVTGSTAYGADSTTRIVGTSWCDKTAAAAFLWEKGGPMIDLNTLIPADSGMQLVLGFGTDDHGEIAGVGVLPDGDQDACRLIPCEGGDDGCGDEAQSGTATKRSNLTLTAAQRLALRRMMAVSRAGMWRRHPFPIVGAPNTSQGEVRESGGGACDKSKGRNPRARQPAPCP
jgi:probable HAF family extracellular repeat protein